MKCNVVSRVGVDYLRKSRGKKEIAPSRDMGQRSLAAAALSFWLGSIEPVAARSFTVAALLLLAWVDSIRRRSGVRWVWVAGIGGFCQVGAFTFGPPGGLVGPRWVGRRTGSFR